MICLKHGDIGSALKCAECTEEDAARYRWLRDNSLGQWDHPIVVSQRRVDRGMQYIGPLVGEELDKAVDHARDAASNEGKGK